MPLSISLIVAQWSTRLLYGGVQFAAFVPFRLKAEWTSLLVEREPRDVHRTMSHGQFEFTIPDTSTVRENFHIIHIATRCPFLRTYINITTRK